MSYYPQQPQQAYGPPQGYVQQPPPQPVYIQQAPPQQSNNDGCCCGLCAGLACCLCLDCLF